MRVKANQTLSRYFSDWIAGEFSQVQEREDRGKGSVGVQSCFEQAEPLADPQGESLDPFPTPGQA